MEKNSEMRTYKETISSLMDQILGEEEAVSRAARLIGDSVMRGQVIHAIGPGGHSNMAVEELFSRAGGLAGTGVLRSRPDSGRGPADYQRLWNQLYDHRLCAGGQAAGRIHHRHHLHLLRQGAAEGPSLTPSHRGEPF